ncbi:hypothetical protein ACMHYO_07720 [Allopusillimonas ginsengisoli]|uniref:hypothetical protein n=1 Tax=Allopusillimonas ginsengisoli TaxID=453575 RepID=UPI0039C3C6E7
MQTMKVDVDIIGAGTAGITAFHVIKAAGKQVALIDHSRRTLGTPAGMGDPGAADRRRHAGDALLPPLHRRNAAERFEVGFPAARILS